MIKGSEGEAIMVNKSGDIGSHTETAVVKVLLRSGFEGAERRRLRGVNDAGDITGTPGVCWSVKGGEDARGASDNLVRSWLEAVETQRINAGAMIGLLVTHRRGKGYANAHLWWVSMTMRTYMTILWPDEPAVVERLLEEKIKRPDMVVRFTLEDACWLLRAAGWGTPLGVDWGAEN